MARESGETAWWRQTWQFAAAIVAGVIVLALVAIALETDLAGPQVFGMPLAEFFALIVVPLIALIAAFVYANRQQALDRRYDVAED